jgi:hypothetical protein
MIVNLEYKKNDLTITANFVDKGKKDFENDKITMVWRSVKKS